MTYACVRRTLIAATLLLASTAGAGSALAQTRVTLKSAAAGSSYYLMTVQLSEALRTATDGRIEPTVEESQGSVQNVKEAVRRSGAFVFTSPPSLVRNAQQGKAPFEGESGYDRIRVLFVMPPVTMHVVTRADAEIDDITDLAGKSFIAGGRGSFTERQMQQVFRTFGLDGEIDVPETELGAAANALRNRQVDGFATGGSHPAAMVQELAATMPIRLVGLTPGQIDTLMAADPGLGPVTIPAGTYSGQDQPVETFGTPVGAYATAAMDDETAYLITRTVWESIDEMAGRNPWWKAPAKEQVAQLGIPLHPGALRYYDEAGVEIPESAR
ncbi:MAG TPA: TAXI family TRAP transporter solute-binding subunit [Arenibaculum sp.]|nr:TAXI family TRAP transporter solute-binding subunit [Arenibaculum sp.]